MIEIESDFALIERDLQGISWENPQAANYTNGLAPISPKSPLSRFNPLFRKTSRENNLEIKGSSRHYCYFRNDRFIFAFCIKRWRESLMDFNTLRRTLSGKSDKTRTEIDIFLSLCIIPYLMIKDIKLKSRNNFILKV